MLANRTPFRSYIAAAVAFAVVIFLGVVAAARADVAPEMQAMDQQMSAAEQAMSAADAGPQGTLAVDAGQADPAGEATTSTPAPATPPPPAPPASPEPTGGTAAPDSMSAPSVPPQQHSQPAAPGQSNVDLPIRIFSPGDDGSVTQQNTGSANAGQPEAASGGSGTPQDWTWNWIWSWSGDCAGDTPAHAAGTSTWNWVWNWDCGGADGSDTETPQTPPSPQGARLPSRPVPQAEAPVTAPEVGRISPAGRRERRERQRPAGSRVVSATLEVPRVEASHGAPVADLDRSHHAGERRAAGGGYQRPALPFTPDLQAAGSAPGSGSSPPSSAAMAALLFIACFAASTFATRFRAAHPGRRSRVPTSRLERPG